MPATTAAPGASVSRSPHVSGTVHRHSDIRGDDGDAPGVGSITYVDVYRHEGRCKRAAEQQRRYSSEQVGHTRCADTRARSDVLTSTTVENIAAMFSTTLS
jgi:hypothetical protein